jgi:hypothetical protein
MQESQGSQAAGSALLQAPQPDDKVVLWVAQRLRQLQRAANVPFYGPQEKVFARRFSSGHPWLYFNYVYAAEWAVVTAGLAILAPRTSGSWRFLIVLLPVWRLAEILIWYVKLLLDEAHTHILSGERNLLFLAIDSATFVTILALLLEAGGGDLPGAIPDALSAFTLNGRPAGYQGPWASVVAVLGAVGGVAMLGAGLALVLEVISRRIKAGPGRYTGPR